MRKQSQRDWNGKRKEQEDDGARNDHGIDRRTANRDARYRGEADKQHRGNRSRPDRSHRRAVGFADARQSSRAGQAAITREGEDHAGGRSHGCQAAQPLRCKNRQIENGGKSRVHPRINRPEKHVEALLGRFVHIGNDENERDQHHPTNQRRPDNRRYNTARHRMSGPLGFFRSVGGSIISRNRIDRQQKAKQEHAEQRVRLRPDRALFGKAGIVFKRPKPRELPMLGGDKTAYGERKRRSKNQIAR